MSASSARPRATRNRAKGAATGREPSGSPAGMPPAPATAAPITPAAAAPAVSATAAPAGMPPAHRCGPALPPGPHPALPPGVAPIGRIPVIGVIPSVDGGTRPAKSVVEEKFWIEARVFREGHDAVNATAVLTDPDGVDHPYPMTCVNVGLSIWNVQVSADRAGWWSFRVEGWSDPWGTWVHDGTIKVEAGIDEELMLEEGARVIERAAAALPDTAPAQARTELRDAVTTLRDVTRPPLARLRMATSPDVHAVFAAYPFREKVSPSAAYPLLVERELA
ncbi:MAG TPA: DUF3416 domain-containing protein, partial [Dermatophilaceae bacterium]|nr:DUF3416 domain-containing protein [Dermatophilaceae bacterium]